MGLVHQKEADMADRQQGWGNEQQDDRREQDAPWQERERREQGMGYPGGGFGSEHRGYAHTQESQRSYGAQHATGYGSHGYGGQTSGPGMQSGYGSQAPYGPQGGSGYEGGPGFGLPGGYGSHGAGPGGAQGEPFGGYGPQGGGYGAQSSYASHGGYGSQGRGSSQGQRWHTGYGAEGGFRSQRYGTRAGHGSQGGYGPQGEAHWPQSNWPQHGNRGQRRGPKGYKRSDERIREDICERLIHSDFIDSSDVTIEVNAGRVVMEGTVPDRRMKHAIEDMAEATSGVTDVENKVRVQQAVASTGRSGSGATGSAGTSGSSSFGGAGSAGDLTGQSVSSTAKKE
jgi:osmotically-inducible protein OsmY